MQKLGYMKCWTKQPLILNPFFEMVLYPPKIFVFAALRKIGTLEKYMHSLLFFTKKGILSSRAIAHLDP